MENNDYEFMKLQAGDIEKLKGLFRNEILDFLNMGMYANAKDTENIMMRILYAIDPKIKTASYVDEYINEKDDLANYLES